MILGGKHIHTYWEAERIHIEPYNPANIGPNSYDVTLGRELLIMRKNSVKTGQTIDGEHFNDPRLPPVFESVKIPDEGYLLYPGYLYLASTVEAIGSDYFVPVYDGRSTLGRWGLFSHVTAGFGDVGFKRQWTLELVTVMPFLLLPGMRIGQVFFHEVTDNSLTYNEGHNYASQSGPTPPKAGNI